MDPGDYYDVTIYVDAHANSIGESPEPQAYPSKVPLTDNVLSSQEIIEPRTYVQAKIFKFKDRVCARGDQHTHEIDYNETFAPTLRYTTLT